MRTDRRRQLERAGWTVGDAVDSQVRLQAVYPVKRGFTVSGSYKHLPGIPITATLAATTRWCVQARGVCLATFQQPPGPGHSEHLRCDVAHTDGVARRPALHNRRAD